MAREQARSAGHALLERFGLAGREHDYPDRLSGGQQQRVAIVRALMTRPRALLLDEVTSALDPELVGEVLAIIRELKSDGMTMLIATHEMGFARDFADEVCFLDGGRIVERGAPEQIFGDPAAGRDTALSRPRAGGARDGTRAECAPRRRSRSPRCSRSAWPAAAPRAPRRPTRRATSRSGSSRRSATATGAGSVCEHAAMHALNHARETLAPRRLPGAVRLHEDAGRAPVADPREHRPRRLSPAADQRDRERAERDRAQPARSSGWTPTRGRCCRACRGRR